MKCDNFLMLASARNPTKRTGKHADTKIGRVFQQNSRSIEEVDARPTPQVPHPPHIRSMMEEEIQEQPGHHQVSHPYNPGNKMSDQLFNFFPMILSMEEEIEESPKHQVIKHCIPHNKWER